MAEAKSSLDRFLVIPEGTLHPQVKRQILASLTVGTKRIPLGLELPDGSLQVPRMLDLGPSRDDRPSPEDIGVFSTTIRLDHRMVGEEMRPTGGTLQQDALNAIQSAPLGGVVQLFCGAGKTVISLKYLAESGHPSVIVVPNLDGMRQWVSAIQAFYPKHPLLAEGRGYNLDPWKKGQYILTTYTSLSKITTHPRWPTVQQRFGTVIFDEAHHVSAEDYLKGASAFSGKRIGLTATPIRQDGLDTIQQMHLGPVIFKEMTSPLRTRVSFLRTLEVTPPNLSSEAHLAAALGGKASRVASVNQVIQELRATRKKVLVISRSLHALVNHLAHITGAPLLWPQESRDLYAEALLEANPGIGFLSAEIPLHLHRRKSPLMFAYSSFGKEAYDDEELDTVVLLEPIEDPAMLTQLLGRPARIFPGKTDPLLCIVEDLGVPSHVKRCKSIRRMLDKWPASAGGKVKHDSRDCPRVSE